MASALGFLSASSLARGAEPEKPTAGGEDAGVEEDDGGDKTVDLSSNGDLVETLGAGPTAPASEAPPAEKPDRFEFRGFARLTAGAGIGSVGGDAPGAVPQERIPYDRAFVEQHLYVDMRYARSDWFQAVISASLALAEFYQVNQASSGAPTSSFDYQRLEPMAREAYLAFYLGRLDLRIGQQRIAWGNSDGFSPNDVLNGRDLRNPLVLDSEMTILPSPAVRADIDMGFAVTSFVFEPFLVTDRVDVYGTNWALLQADAPTGQRRLFGVLARGQDRASVASLQDTLTGQQLAPASSADATIGASLRTHIGSLDVSYYFMSGFDHTPAVYVDPAFVAQFSNADANTVNGAVFDAVLNQARASSKAFGGPIIVSYRRRNHVGFDAQTTLGSFVLRTDVAYDSAKTFFAADTFNAVIRPAIQEVLGLEYHTGNLKKVIVLEGWAMELLDPEVLYVPQLAPAGQAKLIWYQDQNVGLANLVRWSFFENTIFEMRSLVGLAPAYYLLRPEVGYESSTWTLRLGCLAIGGTDGSLGNYYRRNNTVYATTRFSF